MKRFVLSVGMALLVAPLAVAQAYTVTDLGTFPGSDQSVALAINDSAQIAGWASVDDAELDAFLWTEKGGLQDLAPYAQGNAINNSGEVVGIDNFAGAFAWTETGGLQSLGTLGGTYSNSTGINDRGDVVGYSAPGISAVVYHAFVWTSARGLRDLGTLGGHSSWAKAINNHRQVVGYSNTAKDAETHAFLWTSNAGMQDLGTLGGDFSIALAINDSGAIVGTSTLPGVSVQHAFLWTKSDGMQDLGTLGGRTSEAYGINRAGEVVGISDTRKPTAQAVFLWRSGKGMENLTKQISSSSGWLVPYAQGINRAGQIAASGFGPDNPNISHGLLLTPVKTPAK